MSNAPKKKAPTFDPLKNAAGKKPAKKAAAGSAKKTPAAKKTASKKADAPSPAKVDLSNVELPFPAYHEARKGCYYMTDSTGRWNGYGLEDYRRRLRAHAVSGRTEEGTLTSPQDNVLMKVQDDFGIDYAGPLAGRFAGYMEEGGMRILVTTSPKLVTPKAGKFPHLMEFLSGLFGVGMDGYGATQLLVFYLWLARGFRAIAEQKPLRGHALLLAGPAGSGKNALQELIIHHALGGRSVKAGDYLLGITEFNGFMFGGEHLIVSDEEGGRDIRSRRSFGQRIKSVVANGLQSLHKKGCDPFSVSPVWRLTVSVNDDAEHLQTLPPVSDADIADKVHLLRIWPADLPRDDESSAAWRKNLIEEIPALLAHCLALQVPASLKESRPRFGHLAFKHPELLARLNSFSPELHLLGLIDQLMFPAGDPYADQWEPWEGPSSALRTKLVELANGKVTIEREIGDLLRSAEQCGQYLARLLDHHPERVEKPQRQGNERAWKILPPQLEESAP